MRIVTLLGLGLLALPITACEQNAATGEWKTKKFKVGVDAPSQIKQEQTHTREVQSGNNTQEIRHEVDSGFCPERQRKIGECY